MLRVLTSLSSPPLCNWIQADRETGTGMVLTARLSGRASGPAGSGSCCCLLLIKALRVRVFTGHPQRTACSRPQGLEAARFQPGLGSVRRVLVGGEVRDRGPARCGSPSPETARGSASFVVAPPATKEVFLIYLP